MGIPTNLQLVFAAVNPPQTYGSGFMDLAMASRFACVQVPGITEIKDTHLDLILSGNGATSEKVRIKEIVQKARKRVNEGSLGFGDGRRDQAPTSRP